jgi:hypothetical protein
MAGWGTCGAVGGIDGASPPERTMRRLCTYAVATDGVTPTSAATTASVDAVPAACPDACDPAHEPHGTSAHGAFEPSVVPLSLDLFF